MTLPEDNTRLFHSVPSFPHLLALGRICHLFTKGVPRGLVLVGSLRPSWVETAPGQRRIQWLLVFVLPYTEQKIVARECDVLAEN